MARNVRLASESGNSTASVFALCSFRFPTGTAPDYSVIRDQRRTRIEGLRICKLIQFIILASMPASSGCSVLQPAYRDGRNDKLPPLPELTRMRLLVRFAVNGVWEQRRFCKYLPLQDCLRWLGSEAAEFLDTLLASLPSALAIELGDNLPELRSKWGIAAARMIAKRIAEHIAEAARRDDALGAALG
jgi:hypothetical protein